VIKIFRFVAHNINCTRLFKHIKTSMLKNSFFMLE
jgi:hypothetical protein